jgi:hypothetical protein
MSSGFRTANSNEDDNNRTVINSHPASNKSIASPPASSLLEKSTKSPLRFLKSSANVHGQKLSAVTAIVDNISGIISVQSEVGLKRKVDDNAADVANNGSPQKRPFVVNPLLSSLVSRRTDRQVPSSSAGQNSVKIAEPASIVDKFDYRRLMRKYSKN